MNAAAEPPPPGRTRILVVEDEFLIRILLVESLSDEGYEVIEAASADEGLPLLLADPTIRLLLTDVQLPGQLDGLTLAAQARHSRPGLPVIFMSGRSGTDMEAGAAGRTMFIAKPYTPSDIAAAARQLLAEPG